eukprot:scaffold2423_cov113-Chaetoceros_neogracile.AAC.1
MFLSLTPGRIVQFIQRKGSCQQQVLRNASPDVRSRMSLLARGSVSLADFLERMSPCKSPPAQYSSTRS